MWNRTLTISALLVLVLSPLPSAHAIDFAADAHAGSMGLGATGLMQITRNLNLRVGVNSYEYSRDVDDEEGLEYDGTLNLDNQFVMFDWYPSRRSQFRLSLGGYLNDNDLSVNAVVVNDNDAKVGATDALAGTRVTGQATFSDTATYAGLGWGNTFSDGLIHFGFDIGVVLQGSPKVKLTVVLPAGDTSGISDEDVEDERKQLEDKASDYKAWPLLQFNVGFNF